jgi:predicted Zn-dependent protease with MMP-like domain
MRSRRRAGEEMPMRVTPRDFEQLVRETTEKVLAALPDDLREKAVEVTVIAADRATRVQLDGAGGGDDDLLGLYEGISLVDRHVGDTEAVADCITLFRIPLMESCRTMKELREEIRITLLHELGHYFGFEENELEERGL